jgi:hypothetical protein
VYFADAVVWSAYFTKVHSSFHTWPNYAFFWEPMGLPLNFDELRCTLGERALPIFGTPVPADLSEAEHITVTLDSSTPSADDSIGLFVVSTLCLLHLPRACLTHSLLINCLNLCFSSMFIIRIAFPIHTLSVRLDRDANRSDARRAAL